MKKSSKKFVGGLMVVILIATIGAVLVSAQDGESNRYSAQQKFFYGRRNMCESKISFYDLTEEQKEEIKEIVENLKEDGATPEEIRIAVMEKLDEYGVLDERLGNAIRNTEQRLNMLERKQELREEGKSWEEIREIIQDEFDMQSPSGDGHNMMSRHSFHHGLHRCRNTSPDE